ncbi:MAG: aliphatic sulfonate ABC transporter substrate-binding protein [Muricomes sp.]
MKKRVLTKVTVMILAAFAVIGSFGCASSQKKPADSKEQSEEQGTTQTEGKKKVINIGTMNLVNGDLIARQEKYYEQRLDGVEVNIVNFDSGKDVNTALAAGSIDISQLGSNPTALGISSGQEYEVIAIGDIIGSAESLVVKNSSGISSEKDLKGKTIATPFASTAHYSLLNILKLAGISEDEVTLLDMQPDDIYAAWQRGDIDAAYIWYPVLDKLLEDGSLLTGSDKLAEQGIFTADLVVARTAYSEGNPEIVTQFVAALKDANRLIQEDEGKAAQDVSEILEISKEDASKQLKGFQYILAEDQLKEEYLGGNIAKVLKNTADFLAEQQSITEAPELTEFQKHINTKFLKDAVEND